MTDTTNPAPPPAYATAVAQLTAQRDAALARAEAAEQERDALLQKFAHGHIEREIDAQVMADLKRDELADLRAQLEAARQEATMAGRKAAMHERDADEAHQAAAVLQAMFHAAIKAAARTP